MGQWGVHFGRYQTWWEAGKEWFRYLWRCQTLLQAGDIVPASDATSATIKATPAAQLSIAEHPPPPQGHRHLLHRQYRQLCLHRAIAVFRSTGKQPELWDPVWGTMRDLPSFEQANGVTQLQTDFESAQSFFVVFRKPAGPCQPRAVEFPELKAIAAVEGSWKLHFDPAWGGPPPIEFDNLRGLDYAP